MAGTRAAAGKVKAELGGTITLALDASSTGTSSNTISHSISRSFTTGTTAAKADRIWHDKGRTLIQSGTEDLDLYDLAAFDTGAGAGLDALGQDWVCVDVVGLLIHNNASSAGNLVVGNKNGVTAWNSLFNASDTGAIVLGPDAFFLYYNPANPAAVVADSTNHILTFTENGTGAVTFDVTVVGRSA